LPQGITVGQDTPSRSAISLLATLGSQQQDLGPLDQHGRGQGAVAQRRKTLGHRD
jgi:hypothetical protein